MWVGMWTLCRRAVALVQILVRASFALGLVVVLPGFLATACSDKENTLEGSISKDFSLEFDYVEINKLGCMVQIAYIKQGALGQTVPCMLLIDTDHATLGEDVWIEGNRFLDNVQVFRFDMTGSGFPAIDSGSLYFSDFGMDAGDRVRGEFEVDFDNGRDLNGTFENKLKDQNPNLDCEPVE